jgi:acetate kinase
VTGRRVLVVNSGSSSVKHQLLDLDAAAVLAHGIVEHIGEPGGPADHEAALLVVVDGLRDLLAEQPLAAVGHRVVHGGERFRAPALVDDDVVEAIRALVPLAPLHNPANLLGIEVARRVVPGVPHVAVFDTAFHVTLPRAAYLYAVPYEMYTLHGIRRYGFHGTSHAYVAARAAALLDRPLAELDLVTLHLGNGASACAVSKGRSVDTSMGFGPLEGLVMGTRAGDVDATVVLYVARAFGLSVDEVETLLNRESGLKGLAGVNDQREVDRLAAEGDDRAKAALEVATYRIKKYVGAYLAALGRLDAVVFTAGIGEHDPLVRAMALAGLEGLGIVVDPARNHAPAGEARAIHADDSRVAVLVVPTDEELAIAEQALACVSAAGAG